MHFFLGFVPTQQMSSRKIIFDFHNVRSVSWNIPELLLSYNDLQFVTGFFQESLCVTIIFLEAANRIEEKYNHS